MAGLRSQRRDQPLSTAIHQNGRRAPQLWLGLQGVLQDSPVREDERLGFVIGVPLKNFRREVYGSGGAGADQLPQRDLQIAILAGGVVVLGIRIGADGPGRIGDECD